MNSSDPDDFKEGLTSEAYASSTISLLLVEAILATICISRPDPEAFLDSLHKHVQGQLAPMHIEPRRALVAEIMSQRLKKVVLRVRRKLRQAH